MLDAVQIPYFDENSSTLEEHVGVKGFTYFFRIWGSVAHFSLLVQNSAEDHRYTRSG